MLDTVKDWIAGFVAEKLTVDYMDAAAPGAGLFPKGFQQIRRTKDILGNVTVRYRCSFTVKRVVAGLKDKTDPAIWALAFHSWVRSQQLLGKAPRLGEDTHWRAENGRLVKSTQAGTGIYAVDLIVEFTNNGGTI